MNVSETVLYVDSRQRDVTLFPSGNSYTLFLQTPIRNVTRVGLMTAKIPNTMYNLNQSANVLRVVTTTGVVSNVFFNHGFYSTTSLATVMNTQLSNVSTSYIDSEGVFLIYGNVAQCTTLTQEFAQLIGFPFGSSTVYPMSANREYNSMFPTSNAYAVSQSIVSLEPNDYVWLDIEEFRTPFTTDARQLVLNQQGVYTTSGNTSARSFALIPMDVPSGGIKSYKEASDYPIHVEFPSRIDSLDRLTISWLDRNGNVLDFHGLDMNSFTLRVHTETVPIEPERIESLPPPVPFEDSNKKYILWGSLIALIFGLMLILIVGKRHTANT